MGVMQAPSLTGDVDQAKRDIGEHGFALLRDALTSGQVEAMWDRLSEQAECEAGAARRPLSIRDDVTANGSVMSLLNKGKIWQDLIDPSSAVHEVIDHVFTPSFDRALGPLQGLEQKFLLSSVGGGFKRKEEKSSPLFHTDQGFAPGHLDYPLVLNVFYLLTEFDDDNGATLVVPGSHKVTPPTWGEYSDAGAVTIEAPAGTAFIFEGRTWHAAGINVTGKLRASVTSFYCAPYIRQRELLPMNLAQSVVEELSDQQLKLCGFDTMYQGPAGAFIGFNLIEPTLGRTNVSHKATSIGELRH